MCTIGDGISMTWNVAQPPRVRSNSITHSSVRKEVCRDTNADTVRDQYPPRLAEKRLV